MVCILFLLVTQPLITSIQCCVGVITNSQTIVNQSLREPDLRRLYTDLQVCSDNYHMDNNRIQLSWGRRPRSRFRLSNSSVHAVLGILNCMIWYWGWSCSHKFSINRSSYCIVTVYQYWFQRLSWDTLARLVIFWRMMVCFSLLVNSSTHIVMRKAWKLSTVDGRCGWSCSEFRLKTAFMSEK